MIVYNTSVELREALPTCQRSRQVEEINRLLSEEITPTLEKLQKERSNYMSLKSQDISWSPSCDSFADL